MKKILIVEGNLKEENQQFTNAGIQTHTESLKDSIAYFTKNLEARSDMLAAASMGSTAFQKGLGAIHSLSHPVNAQFNLHHGLSNAIFMPYVLTYNKKFIEKRIVSISDFLGLKKDFKSFLDWILELRKELNIPHALSEVIIEDKFDLETLSKMALEDPSTATNPRLLNLEYMKKLYDQSMKGNLFS